MKRLAVYCGSASPEDPRYAALCDDIGLTEYWRIRGIKPDYVSDLPA